MTFNVIDTENIPLKDGAGSPITRHEMQALLDPLSSALQRMEMTLQNLSSNVTADAGLSIFDVGLPQDFADATDIQQRKDHVFEVGPSQDSEDCEELQHHAEAPFETFVPEPPTSKQPRSPSPSQKSSKPKLGRSNSQKSDHSDSWYNVNTGSGEWVEMLQISQALRSSNLHQTHGALSHIFHFAEDGFLKIRKRIMRPQKDYGCLIRIAENRKFKSWCMLVLMFNSGMIAYTADWQLKQPGAGEPLVFAVLEISCLCWFFIELLIRIQAHRCYFFVNADANWNILDFVLVCISVVDLVLDRIVGAGMGGNVGFMRLLRLLKLARVLRALRTFHFFNSLSQLLESLQKSFSAMFWGFIMLGFVLYLFALVFMQALLGVLIESDDLDPLVHNRIVSNFGSLAKTLVSLYMSVTGGNDWGDYFDIVSYAGVFYGVLFLLFTFTTYFALFNILTGMLVEKAFVSNKPDRAENILRQRRYLAEQKSQFVEICNVLDTDGDGEISWPEFKKQMTNPVLLSYMASIGIEVDDVKLFFQTCLGSTSSAAIDEAQIPIEQFVRGCLQMKGTATSIDMQRLLLDTHGFLKEVKVLRASFTNRFSRLEREISNISNSFNRAAKTCSFSNEMLKSNISL